MQLLIEILPGMPFYVHIVNMTAKPFNVQRFMIIAYKLGATTCMIPVREDEQEILKDECSITTQRDKCNSDPIVNHGRYKPHEHSD